jgi:predicted TPR repeat methyltransferase
LSDRDRAAANDQLDTGVPSVRASVPPVYFEEMFASNPDPWQFETSPYESEKYATSIGALAGRRYHRAFEVGCANGVLTERLASICETLLSIDVSSSALATARTRNEQTAHVEFQELMFPGQTPDGSFDLIVLSEVVYYWSSADIAAAAAWISQRLEPGGELLLVHWIGETDYPQTGDGAVDRLRQGLPTMKTIRADRYEKYRLDLWRA